jgi:hypothetical protein
MAMETSIQQCPGCGAVVYFAHPDTTLIPCTCGTVVNRKEGGILLAKPYAILSKPFDAIQPGTTGIWQGRSFKVLGRFRVWLEESVFNYWTIVLDGDELAYLAECYGLYAILKKTSAYLPPDRSSLGRWEIGHAQKLGDTTPFVLEKKDTVQHWEIEGEVWLPETNDTFTIYEMASESGICLHLFQFLPNYSLCFETQFVSFSDLQLQQLRDAAMPGKEFACKNCSETILLKTYPYAQSCACKNCGTRYVLDGSNIKRLDKRNELENTPDLQLGAKGIIANTEYEVLGFAIKEENNRYASKWREYTLYSRREGYAFLSEYDGHWIFLREVGQAPVLSKKTARSFEYNGEPFQLYNGYSYQIVQAAGEFPYNAFDNSQTYVKEYISPPEMWSQEKNSKEGIIWFKGEHISGSDLRDAFGKAINLPYKNGIGAVEPKFFLSPPRLATVTAFAILCLVLLHVLISMSKREQIIADDFFTFNDSTNTATAATGPIRLDKWRSNLQFRIQAPVSNDWMELGAALVNTKTGTEYNIEKGVEYYSGYSEGERWTEGSQEEDAYITQVPAGEYQILLQGVRDPYSLNKVENFRLQVLYDVSNHRNLFFCILLMLIWPAIQYYRTNTIEKQRWENSPYTPFNYED